MVTIYPNIVRRTEYHHKPIDVILERIRTGKSKKKIEELRATIDKEKANSLKRDLPSICFSGTFTERKDENLIKHSGFIVLDFDNIDNIKEKINEIKNKSFIYACWISPRGNGIKALVKIANGNKHQEHFAALQDVFPEIDKSGKNVSRVCYESYDPNIYINKKSEIFKQIKEFEQYVEKQVLIDNYILDNILKWLSNKGDAFKSGERNLFIYKFASACCRFGVSEFECLNFCLYKYAASDFSKDEITITNKSAYKSNRASFGTAIFEKEILVNKENKREIEINTDIYDKEIKPRDILFGIDVKDDALNLYDNGYESVNPIGISQIDEYFKMKRQEMTLLSGIGNYGKSSFMKWYLLIRVLVFKEKFCFFAPEDNPAHEFYHDFVEIYLGCDCTPCNEYRPIKEKYAEAYDFISKYIFYIYPKDVAPTPEYIKERFLEMIIKENIDCCIIDPFNQLDNNYGANTSKYLEKTLADFHRFIQRNNVYFLIIAHPHAMQKDKDGNYPCPDIFDLNDGAMWNNKMDNILIYHRKNHQTNPNDASAEFHTKKIRRQKTVGKKGVVYMELNRKKRRFLLNGHDYIAELLSEQTTNNPDFIYDYKNSVVDKFSQMNQEQEIICGDSKNAPF